MRMDTLKLASPYMHGPAVKRLQEFGDLLGHDYGPNDGIFGSDTERAVRGLQEQFGLRQDGICGPKTWKAILAHLDKDHVPQGGIIDIIGQHKRPKLYGRQRSWDDITGVTLHQTGCRMPSDPHKWRRLNAHIGLPKDGGIVLVNAMTDMIWHGQGLSQSTIGIEIEGNFMGVEGKPHTLWKGGGPAAHLTDGQLLAIPELFKYLQFQFGANGQIWSVVRGHRQSSRSRCGDPGSAIWKNVAMPWIEKLKATDGGPGWSKGTGRPIPGDWNPEYHGTYR
jgi:hypothetical protein